jgi:hypothetical protein
MAKPLLLVLAHGIFEWSEPVRCDDQTKDYFFGVLPFIEKEYGVRSPRITAPAVSAAESVAVRGQDLAEAIGDSSRQYRLGRTGPTLTEQGFDD